MDAAADLPLPARPDDGAVLASFDADRAELERAVAAAWARVDAAQAEGAAADLDDAELAEVHRRLAELEAAHRRELAAIAAAADRAVAQLATEADPDPAGPVPAAGVARPDLAGLARLQRAVPADADRAGH